MVNYFRFLNEAFDRTYGNNNTAERKRCNLVETAEADWDWYEDGFTSPLYRLYGQAFEEAGFDEHADVQSGMGEVYISKKGDPEGMFVADFEDVNDFMNRIHTSMVQGKLTDEKRIKEIIFQGVLDISRWRDYPDFENANESFKTSKRRKLKEANTDWYSMEWDDQVNAIKRFVKNYRGSKVFEDFAASVGADVDDVIDAFADMESYGVIEIPKEIQIDDKYRNDDIYESKRKLKEARTEGNAIDRYQRWVDFDMAHYGKISKRTQDFVNKAGYQIIKDDHGDYEVAAGHFE